MQEHHSLKHQKDATISIREEIEKYLAYWPWFILGVFICLTLAYTYLRYTVPVYRAVATILVRDDRKGNMPSEMSAFSDLGLMGNIKNNVDNEIEIIRSRTILQKSIDSLHLNVSYFAEGRIKSVDLYKDAPVSVAFFDRSEAFYNKYHNLVLQSVSDKQFEILTGSGQSKGKFTYGNIVDLGYCKIIVTRLSTRQNNPADYSLSVKISPLAHVTSQYKARISVASMSKTSSVVELAIADPIPERAEDLLNAIIANYNRDAINDKRVISMGTEAFITERLKIIESELGSVERDAAGFKSSNRLTDISSDAGMFLQNSVDFQKALIETETQLRIVADMMSFLESNTSGLVPSNIIPNDQTATTLIAEHNNLFIERERYLKSGTESNAIVQNATNKLQDLRFAIQESLARLNASLKIRKSDLEKQVNMVVGKISQIPGQEREFRIIDRQQKIKEALYIYLLEKREEIAISLAVTAPNAKVIDPALSTTSPVSPRKNIIYLIALVLGLGIPFLVIYVLHLLDTKVKTREHLSAQVSAPFLGDVPMSETNDEILSSTSRSSAAEGIRIVRTNLEFMLSRVPEGRAKTIGITSTVPKEGKTFVAINMAAAMALSGRKVLLIGLDVRNPKLDQYLNIPAAGLTNYLVQSGGDIRDFIAPLPGYDHFHVLSSGAIPPNPVDLLMNGKLGPMFDTLKAEYDYIVIDTAPMSLVTDTLLISEFADAFVYVVRANYLDKRMLPLVESFYTEGKLPNMAVLLNDTVWKSLKYGYGYGYGYGQDEPAKKPWARFKK